MIEFAHTAPIVETQVKERLTGAVILVALVVLLVPELLSGPGQSASPNPRPVDEQPMRSYTIDLAHDGTAGPGAVTPSVPADSTEDAALDAAVVAAPKEAAPAAPPAKPQASAPPPYVAPAAVKSAPAVVPKPAPEPPPVTGWCIQVGSFASGENARRLVQELKGKGFAAFVEPGGGTRGHLYRVRVGPEADRAAVTALSAKLRAIGKSGAVVPYP